jgi:hypothetical protein
MAVFLIAKHAERGGLLNLGNGLFNDCMSTEGELTLVAPHGVYRLKPDPEEETQVMCDP